MFYIAIKCGRSQFLLVGEKDENVAEELGLSAEVDAVPLQDHALIFLEVDIDHLLLHHYIIIGFINLKPNYRQSSTLSSTDCDPTTATVAEKLPRGYAQMLDFSAGVDFL